jgi:hypothetical protein
LILALAILCLWLFLRRPADPAPPLLPAALETPCPRSPPRPASPPRPSSAALRFIAVGAVDSPEQNGVSIEQDLELARSTLGAEKGLVLYAGGPGSRDVQVEARQSRGDPLLTELAALIAPRGGRRSRYREGTVPRHGAASLPELDRALREALGTRGPPLLLYLAGHGERGQHAAESYLTLWGGRRLDARALARRLDGAKRPVLLVATSCYAGGLAETIFVAADPEQGGARERCGFFATTSDLPATGCDPNPDRLEQEGYALHFWNALRRRDRDGRRLAIAELDLDGDGEVSPAEAHARARIALDAVDVPISTSERWLRGLGLEKWKGREPRAHLVPEESAVVRALAKQTRLPVDLEIVRSTLRALEEQIDEAYRVYDDAARAEDDAARRTVASLLSRWPVLDDPWHPEFATTVRCQRAEIADQLKRSPAYEDYRGATRATNEAEAEHWRRRRRAAPVERLLRALEHLAFAARLRARGGAAWARYREILACERARF